jgi:predicted transcriptional regulator
MEDKELDSVLQVLENPIRRKIIKQLSHGSSYPLRLAKELSLGQPLVAKHLAAMEEAGVVTSSMVKSSTGPDRRTYSLSKSISITLDVAPNLFVQRGFSFGTLSGTGLPNEMSDLIGDVSRISWKDEKAVSSLSSILEGVDDKLNRIEEQRAVLLYVRNMAMSTASEAIKSVKDDDKKKVLYSVLESHSRNVEDLSEYLDMREVVVRQILKDLREMLE